MTNKKTKDFAKDVHIREEIKITVDIAFREFCDADEQKELEFPAALTSEERRYIHELAKKSGLKSKSRGKNANRFVTIYKKEKSSIVKSDASFRLQPQSKAQLKSFLEKNAVSPKERQELLPLTERERSTLSSNGREVTARNSLKLSSGITHVPPAREQCELSNFRQSLPIWEMREDIMRAINSHQIVIIAGETGSGKTTQVPQFILDQCAEAGRQCRIVCTQPRRISAIAMADRVSQERGESVGSTVGYHIRLESNVGIRTVLTFCTAGILLRTLMSSDANLTSITHIILDEVHERDKITDFLMTVLKESVVKFRNLKLILMSATLDLKVITNYFPNSPIINVVGNLYDVKEYYLEDVLNMTDYMSTKDLQKKKVQSLNLKSLTLGESASKDPSSFSISNSSTGTPILAMQNKVVPDKEELSESTITHLNKCLEEAIYGNEDALSALMNSILIENVSVDYESSQYGCTALMVAAFKGNVEMMDQLLNLGASISVKDGNGWTAYHWAKYGKQEKAMELLDAYMNTVNMQLSNADELFNTDDSDKELTEEMKELLKAYHSSWDDEKVDEELLITLLHKIHTSNESGGVLVFLPGYEEIIRLKDSITSSDGPFASCSNYVLFMLHSSMTSPDHGALFRPAKSGTRKIILATNIAETAITIDDVVFVIDSGKVKEKSVEGLTGVSTLRAVWISQSSAKQRKGRAGRTRPGKCYRLYSRLRFRAMQPHPVPEILRVPLHELCLHVKLLAPQGTTIANFIARAPEPPSVAVTRASIQLLKTIDALDQWEEVTEMGHHLLDLSLDPRLGKMLLFSVVLKCLDPVLTIVCCLAYRDPFILPGNAYQKRLASENRKQLAVGTFSDHMTLLRAFNLWQKAMQDGQGRKFCEKNFLSYATMDMILNMRTPLISQLRASGFIRTGNRGNDVRELNLNSDKWAVVKAALVAGMYPNLLRVDKHDSRLLSKKESKVRLHPSSSLLECPKSSRITAAHQESVNTLPTEWLIYDEMSRSGTLAHARCVTLVTPITVALFAGPSVHPFDNQHDTDAGHGGASLSWSNPNNSDSEEDNRPPEQNTMFKIDDWVGFHVEHESAGFVMNLRHKLHALFLRRMKFPAKQLTPADDELLSVVTDLLVEEDMGTGLVQPAGIGQRPLKVAYDAGLSSSYQGRRNSNDSELTEDSHNDYQSYYNSRSYPYKKNAGYNSYQKKPHNLLSPKDRNDTRSRNSQLQGAPQREMGNDNKKKYFMIRVAKRHQIEASKQNNSLWFFSPQVEKTLVRTVKEGWIVVLLFITQQENDLVGVAQMRDITISPTDSNDGKRLYHLEWIHSTQLPFHYVRNLNNPYDNRRLLTSRDGQEVDPKLGESLCLLWNQHGVTATPPPPPIQTSYANRFSAPPPNFVPQPHGGRQMRRFNQPRLGMYPVGRGVAHLPNTGAYPPFPGNYGRNSSHYR